MRRLIVIAIVVALLLGCAAPALAQDSIKVYYAGPVGGVRAALDLAARFEGYQIVGDLDQADVFLLNGEIPDPQAIAGRVKDGAGLVLILGPDLNAASVGTLLGRNVSLEERDDPLSLDMPSGVADIALQEIMWSSAPQVRERYVLGGAPVAPLVIGFEDGSTILGADSVGSGTAFIFTAFLDSDNPQFQEWAYFNYLIYHLLARSARQTPQSFADYPGSPVPHDRDRLILFIAMGGVLAISAAAYWLVRRYSLAHPQALDAIVTGREEFQTREAGTDWEEIGFHRPLGGYMLGLMLGLVMFIPLIIYQNLILPGYILPSAQALGIWGRVTQFFNVFWFLFDMGTSVAFIKFMAQYRVKDPRRGILYGQVFVWWQALSGAVQVAAVTLLASTVAPRTAYALYAWSVIIHSFIQIPGFYQLIRHALMGLQRLDYAQTLELLLQLIFPIITQPLLVTLMVIWGRGNPIFGPSMGGLLGLGLAAYASEALTLLLGLWLYRRLGYNARVLFLAHFDWETVKESFRFGVFEMLGSLFWGIGQAAEILITQLRLVNYAEVWGNWTIAQNFVFAFNASQILYNGLMPSISEAASHARLALSQFYSAMAYKWGGMISAFIGAVLLAVADRFILGSTGPEFERAALLAGPLIVWGAIQYPSWVGDNVALGANRPYLKSIMVGAEQVIRLALAWLLLRQFQIFALIIAYFIGLGLKDITFYFVNERLCFRQRFYWWQSLIAPLLAGAAHYFVVRFLTGLIWQHDQITSVIIFFLGILPSFPLFAFFYGLFGGWDDGGLAELRRAADLASFMKPLAWLFWATSVLGARISPLHNRFPIDIRQAAMEEARTLTEEKVPLLADSR